MAIVGKEIKDWLVDQINYRQEIYGKTERTVSDINYLNNRNSWIKIASAVVIDQERLDLLNQYDGPQLGQDNIGRGLAKNFVLFNGVSQTKKFLSKGGGSTQNTGNPSDEGFFYDKGEVTLSPLPTNIGQGWDAVYGFGGTEFGIDPMPGIESLDVKYLNRGALKEINFKIKCFNRNQFNIIDNLYLRLGFSILIEWGNNLYIDEDGNYQPVGRTVLEKYWFREGQDESSIRGFIESNIQTYKGSYEGIIARITNFEWNFNDDGSYDINVKAISKGDIIESLKANPTPPKKIFEAYSSLASTIKPGEGEEETSTPDFGKNVFSALKFSLNLLHDEGTKQSLTRDGNVINAFNKDYQYTLIEPSTGDTPFFTFTGLQDNETRGNEWEIAEYYRVEEEEIIFISDTIVYDYSIIQFYLQKLDQIEDGISGQKIAVRVSVSLADELNSKGQLREYRRFTENENVDEDAPIRSVWLVDVGKLNVTAGDIAEFLGLSKEDALYLPAKPDNQIYIKFGYLIRFIDTHLLPEVDYGNTGEYKALLSFAQFPIIYALPYLIPHDPRVCIFKFDWDHPITKEKFSLFPQLKNLYIKYKKIPSSNNETKQYVGVLENLYLNLDFVMSCLSENEDGDSFVFDFLKNICDGINKAMGGINNIEPSIDPALNKIRFIENTPIPGYYKPPEKSYQLEVFGYSPLNNQSNFVQKVGIQTTISKEYASMITIGSTAKGYSKGMEASAFSKWNRGCEDYYQTNIRNKFDKDEEKSIVDLMIEKVYPKDAGGLSIMTAIFGGFTFSSSDVTIVPNFTENNLDQNLGIATEYYKYIHALNAQQSAPNELTPSTIGFLPFNLKLTLDGISGFRIYELLKVNTRFLPSNYPKSLDFVITKVNHTVSNNDWFTEIETIATPKMSFKDGEETLRPITEGFILATVITEALQDLYSTANNTLDALSNLAGDIIDNALDAVREGPSLPPPTSIGTGDRIRVDADVTTPWRKSTKEGIARGSYRYLQIITQNPKYGDGTYFPIPNSSAVITSGFGLRNVAGGELHPAIDIAGIGNLKGRLPQTCPFELGIIDQQYPNIYGIIRIKELNPQTLQPTGRYARFLHSTYFGFTSNKQVKFNDIVGREGGAGENNPKAYGLHSHFEIFFDGNPSTTTVDGKRTSRGGTYNPLPHTPPTLEEIKCAHGLSSTPLKPAIKETANGKLNYKCIY